MNFRCFRRTIISIGARRLPARGRNEMLSDDALIQNILGCVRREVFERGQKRGRIDREIESRRRRVMREEMMEIRRKNTMNTKVEANQK